MKTVGGSRCDQHAFELIAGGEAQVQRVCLHTPQEGRRRV